MADIELTLEDLPKLKVAELKKALKDRGLSVTGTKAELLTRLQETIQLQDSVNESGDLDSEQDINLEDTLEEDTEEIEEESSEPAVKKIVLSEKDDIPHTEETKIVLSKGLTDEERLKKRAEKFGIQSEEARKKLRAERFGVETSVSGGKLTTTAVTSNDLDKLKQRAERFGGVVSNQLSKLEEDAKIQKRKERFGTVLPATTNTTGKVQVNKVKTVSSVDDIEKKRKRAERFGLT